MRTGWTEAVDNVGFVPCGAEARWEAVRVVGGKCVAIMSAKAVSRNCTMSRPPGAFQDRQFGASITKDADVVKVILELPRIPRLVQLGFAISR